MKSIRCQLDCATWCEYFKSGECTSQVKCKYQTEHMSVTFPEAIFVPTKEAWEKMQAERSRLTAENAELRTRLEKAVEPQFSNGDEVYAIMDTLLYTGVIPVTIKSADVVYEVFDGEQITTQHRTRIFTTRAEAEARLKELNGGER